MLKVLIFMDNWSIFWDEHIFLSFVVSISLIILFIKTISIIEYFKAKKVQNGRT